MTTTPDQKSLPDVDGFFLVTREALPPKRGVEPQVEDRTIFIPHAAEELCPCGSRRSFGECCLPFGTNRFFVRTPGGGYAPAMLYTERWADLPFADVRAQLMAHPALWCTEDTLFQCFWHYRPAEGGSQETFGNLELTPDGLALTALSKPRYTALRSLAEEALGPLPIGERHVSALVTDTATGEFAGENSTGADADAAEIPILEAYAATRARLRALNNRATKELTGDEMLEAAKRLRLLSPAGSIVFDDKQDISVLADFALYEVQRLGQPIIRCFMRKHPVTDREGTGLYQALEQSWVSLFLIERKTPEGLVVRDLADASRPVCHLVDIGLIHSALPGMALVGRLLPAPRFSMLSGWGFAVQPEQVDQVLREVRRIAQTESRRARVSTLIRYCRNELPPLAIGEKTL